MILLRKHNLFYRGVEIVRFSMSRIIFKQFKIFYSVIRFNAVFVMDYFAFLQGSTKKLLHDVPMFTNGLFVNSYTNISTFIDISSTSPTRMIHAVAYRCYDNAVTFSTTSLSFIRFVVLKSLFTDTTINRLARSLITTSFRTVRSRFGWEREKNNRAAPTNIGGFHYV